MNGQELFNVAITICGMAGIPLLKFFWDRIKEAKAEAIAAAHDATKEMKSTADEAKRLAIDALDKLNSHRLHVASNHPTNSAIEKMEKQIAEMGRSLFEELKEISQKLDGKADKTRIGSGD